jgi:hypothetical protein
MGTTEKVARLIVNTTFEQSPPEAIQVAKGALLDGLGAAIAGAPKPTSGASSPVGPKRLCHQSDDLSRGPHGAGGEILFTLLSSGRGLRSARRHSPVRRYACERI